MYTHFKSDLINNMDHMRISAKQINLKSWKVMPKNV